MEMKIIDHTKPLEFDDEMSSSDSSENEDERIEKMKKIRDKMIILKDAEKSKVERQLEKIHDN